MRALVPFRARGLVVRVLLAGCGTKKETALVEI